MKFHSLNKKLIKIHTIFKQIIFLFLEYLILCKFLLIDLIYIHEIY